MNPQKKILVVGCSYARGHGLNLENKDPDLWVNKLFASRHCHVDNRSKTGANNHWIFLETVGCLLKQTYDFVLVSWTSIPRYNFHAGLELYSVDTMLNNMDVNINNNTRVSGKWLEAIGNNLRKIHNDHWDLLDLIKYVNVLVSMQGADKIVFVNGLGPWSKDYFVKKSLELPSDLLPYEQDLLQVRTRDDQEIFALYDMIHDHYTSYGGIHQQNWLNLYSSLRDLQVDTVSDQDLHPGYSSQQVYVDTLAPQLQQRLLLS
jgi:hypothetical protein